MDMENELYGVIAYAMRYWFLGLLLAALCAAVNVLRRARKTQRDSSALPDAGMIGEWALLREDGSAAALLPAPHDGIIGESRLCDVRVPGLPRFAASYSLERDGVHLRPFARCALFVEGQPVRKKAVLRHGAVLRVGERALQLRLFAGVLLKGETPENTIGAGESM